MYRDHDLPLTYGAEATPDVADNRRDRFEACVRQAFPSMTITHARLDDSGGDHALLIVNDTHAFRFPRAGMHSLRLERKVLAHLQSVLDLPTPVYDYVDPEKQFAGYRFIPGSALTPQQFAQLPTEAQHLALAAIATFLRKLHGIEALAAAPLAEWPLAWTAAQYSDRARDEQVPLFRTQLPKLAPLITAFAEHHRTDRPNQLVVVHGDLVTEHILFDNGTQRLAGIIDFGDVALGDPAQDMLGCWSYGLEAVMQLIAAYGSDDQGLFARSRNHFIRYRIDRIFEQLSDGLTVDANGTEVSQLTRLLVATVQQ